MHTRDAYKSALDYAENLGKEHGRNAADWWEQDAIGGRTSSNVDTAAVARRVIKGLDDGDPEILDTLPHADLSGQWADEMTGQDLVAEATDHAGLIGSTEEAADWFGDIYSAYEMAFEDGVSSAIYALCADLLRYRCLENSTHSAYDITTLCPNCLEE